MADKLCTKDQVKARLFPAGVTPDTTDDTMIDELIEEVTDWVQHFTGRKFVAVTSADYYFDTVAGRVLHVPMGVRAVTFLGVAGVHQPDTGGTYTTITATNILLRPSPAELPVGWPFTEIRLSQMQTIIFGNVENGAKVTCTAGFATVPPDMQAVGIDGTVAAYQMRKNGASGVFGADSETGVPWWQFTAASMRILKMYRYPGIA